MTYHRHTHNNANIEQKMQ